MKRIALGILLLGLLTPYGFSVSVKSVNLVQMVEKAERVFHGRCLSRETIDENSAIPIVEYRFQVKQAIKGVTDGETVVFRQVQGARASGRGLSGVPEYRVGEELVLFLKKESRRGLTSPVGLGQGTFLVKKNGRDAAEVMNLVGNRNLGIGLSADEQAGIGTEQVNALKSGRAIPLASFASVVHKVGRLKGPDDRNK